jgi:hypothetical protein
MFDVRLSNLQFFYQCDSQLLASSLQNPAAIAGSFDNSSKNNTRCSMAPSTGRVVVSVDRKSEASHVQVRDECMLPRIFDNET